MITVVVTGVGSNIGQGIVKALRMAEMDVRIIGTDMNSLSAGLFRCDKGYVIPPATSEGLLGKIMEVCNEESVDVILIGSDAEVPFFAAKKAIIERNTKAKIIVSNSSLVHKSHDKWETAKFLNDNGLAYPRSSLKETDSIQRLKNEVGFPLVIKPKMGAGSRNVFVAKNYGQLECALAYVNDPVIQEYIPGEEYTSGVFFDKSSRIKGIITMKRELRSGTTCRAIVDDFTEIKRGIMPVAELLSKHGAIGPVNIQSRYYSGKVYTLEVNSRFSGTTVFRAKFNFNEPEAVLKHFVLGEDIDEFKPLSGVVMRYCEEVYTTLGEMKRIDENGFIEDSKSVILRLF